MGGTKEKATVPGRVAFALCVASAILFASNVAVADGPKKVVVTKFEGPEDASDEVRKAVLEVLEDFYDVVPYRKYRIERRRLGARKRSKKKTIAQVARRLGCDAIIYGQVDGRRLTVKVREGGSGVLIGKFRVNVGGGVSESTLEELENELTDLIDATEPVDDGEDTLDEQIRPANAAQTRLASVESAAASSPATARRVWDEVPEEAVNKPSKPSPIALQAAVGIGGTARSLEFAYQGGLSEEERPQSMAGSPALGVAFSGTANLKALGISAKLDYERSVGASLSIRDGAGSKRVGMAQKHWGLELFISRPVTPRITLSGGAGYHQLGFNLSNKPNGLRLHDTRYSYTDVGGGARFNVRDDRVVLTANASYMYVIAMGGISDPRAYGSARAQGFRGEAGLELEATETTFVRVALRYSRLVLYFDGTGELSTDLDDNADIDVSGAADTYVGGVAMMGFHF